MIIDEVVWNVIKNKHTLRQRMSMPKFLATTIRMVNCWSTERDPANIAYFKPFVEVPTVKHEHQVDAYQWLKDESRDTLQKSSSVFFYRSSASSAGLLQKDDIKIYQSAMTHAQFKSFGDFNRISQGIWMTTLDLENYMKSTCTCPEFFRNYMCKHTIGCAALEKIIKIPSKAKVPTMC